jgi:hypothetical protein
MEVCGSKLEVARSLTSSLSLGTIIWECLTGTFPFSCPPPDVLQRKTTIQEALGAGASPWDLSLTTANNSVLDQIRPYICDCWSVIPTLRPPAAFVTQKIFDVLTLHSAHLPAVIHSLSSPLKERALRSIRSKREKKSILPVASEDAQVLKRFAGHQLDPHASFLFGASLWWDLVPLDDELDDECVNLRPPAESKSCC